MNRSYFFVRHGRAVYQEKGFVQAEYPPGVDLPLSDAGRDQARAVAPRVLRLGVTRVVSSELSRATETADAIATAGRLPFDPRLAALNEIHPTSLKVDPPLDASERWSWWDGYLAARAVRETVATGTPVPGWELRAVEDRIRSVLRRLDELPDSRVAIAGHGYWILLASLLVRGRVRYRWIENCSVTRIDADGEGRYRLISFASVL